MCWTFLQELEAFYTQVHTTESRLPIFPQAYPTSCLLGCIDVVDCLTVSAYLLGRCFKDAMLEP